ncbi:MAG: PRC-barrel domain-containing protein [Vicinamibacterales bacterium]
MRILARDGEIGSVDECYFDDEHWAVRYLVVDTGKWLPGRQVLISPISVEQGNWTDRTLTVRLTRDEVARSPDIDTHQPVSRQHEATYARYYSQPYYWGSSSLWGPALYPSALAEQQMAQMDEDLQAERDRALEQGDDRLRRTKEVSGYHIEATDGEIGHVSDFLMDEESWAIRYFVVNTSAWWFGQKVLVARSWVGELSWLDRKVRIDMTRDEVKAAPPYDELAQLDRQWEEGFYTHFKRPPYWSANEHPGDSPARRPPPGGWMTP